MNESSRNNFSFNLNSFLVDSWYCHCNSNSSFFFILSNEHCKSVNKIKNLKSIICSNITRFSSIFVVIIQLFQINFVFVDQKNHINHCQKISSNFCDVFVVCMFHSRSHVFVIAKCNSIIQSELIVFSYIVHQQLIFSFINFINQTKENFQQKFMRCFVICYIETLRTVVYTNEFDVMRHYMQFEYVEMCFIFVVDIIRCVLKICIWQILFSNCRFDTELLSYNLKSFRRVFYIVSSSQNLLLFWRSE